ncbi:hypothetical protein NP233_g8186 [Leucocoprinus birnbaumii]|uniref:Uncharacterized protein n=1 Tax=Leucocoprinus birnbaumii TaxID=56174 RepID=A0AAD5VMX8_9AGAR|nr:hypothetical protein NP233_g8186 [Leucocoprinus birnbaumii]
MPSINPATALLKIYCSSDAAPWRWPTWQDLTGVHHGLCPPNDNDLPAGWTRENANDVLSFFQAFRDIQQEDRRLAFAETKKGNSDYPGRDFFKEWVGSLFKKAGIHNIIVSEFKAGNIHPASIYIREGVWPPANDYLAVVIDNVAMRLFGEESFDAVSGRVSLDYRAALKALMQQSWTKIRNQINYAKASSGRIETAARNALHTLKTEEVTKGKVAAAIRAVAKWKECLELTKTASEVKEAQGMLEELETIMQDLAAAMAAKKESNPETRPKIVNRAVANLATKEDVSDLFSFYQEYFEGHLEDEDDILALENYALPATWEDNQKCDFGMEIESGLTSEALGLRLGIGRECHIPLFNEHRHSSGITPWDDEKEFAVTEPLPSHLTPLSLHWHQLAGIHSILRSLFSDQPDENRPTGVLVADAVGLGKTCQSIGTIAMLNAIIFCQEGKYKLPQVISERPYLGTKASVPKLPHLIVCPGTLTNQWISEIKTLFVKHAVDIFVYDSQTNSKAFWGPSGPLTSSNHPLQNCIIVATHSAVWNDFRLLHNPVTTGVNSRPWDIPRAKLPTGVTNTIFGQQFLSIIVDEAHHMRNVGNRHAAILRLLDQGNARIIMTATPLLTAPKDVASMGRLVGVRHFFSEVSHLEEKEDAKVMRKLKKLDDSGEALSRERLKIVTRHQNHCRGHLLRRSATSTNNDKAPLLDLPPYREIIGLVELTEREKVIIEERSEAAKAAVMSASDARIHTKKFYLEYRLAVGYAKDDASSLLPSFKSLKEWNLKKSTKMDVCALVCAHYLADDRVEDVSFQDGDVVLPDIPTEYNDDPQKTRRIIVYAEFPSMAPLLQNVLSLYRLDSLVINGKHTFKQRDQTIKKFYDDKHPARILVFSSVGSAGLNLAIADVVILFDQPWSSQDECQIIGQLRALLQGQVVDDGKLVDVPNEDDDSEQVPIRPRRRRRAAVANVESDSEPRPTRAPRRPRRSRRQIVVDEDEPTHSSPSNAGEATDSAFGGPSDGNTSEPISTGASTPSAHDDMPGLISAPETTTDEDSSYAGHTNRSESEFEDGLPPPRMTSNNTREEFDAFPPLNSAGPSGSKRSKEPHLTSQRAPEPEQTPVLPQVPKPDQASVLRHVPKPEKASVLRHVPKPEKASVPPQAPKHDKPAVPPQVPKHNKPPVTPQVPKSADSPYADLPPSDDAYDFYPSPVNEDEDDAMSDVPALLDHGKIQQEVEPGPEEAMPDLPLPEDDTTEGGSQLCDKMQYAVTNRRGLLFRPNLGANLPSSSTTRGDSRPPAKRSRQDGPAVRHTQGQSEATRGTSRPVTPGTEYASLPSTPHQRPEVQRAALVTPGQQQNGSCLPSRPEASVNSSRKSSAKVDTKTMTPLRVESQHQPPLPSRSATGPSEPTIFSRRPEAPSKARQSKPNPFARRPLTAPGASQSSNTVNEDVSTRAISQGRIISSSRNISIAASSTVNRQASGSSNTPVCAPTAPCAPVQRSASHGHRRALPATQAPTTTLPPGADDYDIPPMSAMMGQRSEPKGKGKEKVKDKENDAWPGDV